MSSSGNSRDPLRGFLSYFYGNFIVLLLGFIQTPLLTRILSTDQFGRSGMFEPAVSVIYIFSIIGLDQAFIRYYYDKDVDRSALLRRCLLPPLGILSVLSILYIVFAEQANAFLFGFSGRDVIALVVVYTLISVFERFLFLDVRMEQNGVLYSNINITEKVLSIAAVIVFFKLMGDDFRVGLYALVVPWGLTTLFLAVRYLIKNRKSVRVTGSRAPSYRELITYGIPFISVLLMEWALSSCDRVALRLFADFGELGIYDSAMKIIVLLLTFKNTFIAFWSPVAMEKFEKEGESKSAAFFREAYDNVVFLASIAAVLMILFRKLIVLILGPDYRSAEAVLPFLTLMPVFAVMFEITNQSIKYSKKGKYLYYASLFAIAVNIGGNFLLVPKLGGMGAAITTGLSYIVYFAAGSVFAEKCIRIGYDHRKTMIYATLLLIYCTEASLMNSLLWDSVCGVAIIVLALIFDRKTFMKTVGYVKRYIRKD